MHSLEPQRVGPSTSTIGAVDLVQGAYGAHGNLELVACDADDGLWVFWFNADAPDDPPQTPDVPPGQWSAGLRFATGGRYTGARILQATTGPLHLEVLALDDSGVLQSWYWSPGPGFQRRQRDAATGVAGFAAAHAEGALHVTVADADGALRHLASSPEGYPLRTWEAAASGPVLDRAADDDVAAAGVDLASVVPGTARRAMSTRDGGTAELVWRDVDGSVRHVGVPLRG